MFVCVKLYPYYSAVTDAECGPVPVIGLDQLNKTNTTHTAPLPGCSLCSPVSLCSLISNNVLVYYLQRKGNEFFTDIASCLLSLLMCYLFEREYAVLLGKGRLKVFWNFCFGWFGLFFFYSKE